MPFFDTVPFFDRNLKTNCQKKAPPVYNIKIKTARKNECSLYTMSAV